MTRLHPCASILPHSLLPFLHDCLHRSPILYHREFEVIYRIFDNWEELEALAAKIRSRIAAFDLELLALAEEERVGRRCCLGLRAWWRKRRQWRLELKRYRLKQTYAARMVDWLLLLDLRARYLEQQDAAHGTDETTSLSSSHELHLADLPTLPHPLTKAERDYLARHGITFPDAPSDLLPPYPTIRPSFTRNCPLFILTQVNCKHAKWDSNVRSRFAEDALEQGEAQAEEERKVWQCYSEDEPELFYQR